MLFPCRRADIERRCARPGKKFSIFHRPFFPQGPFRPDCRKAVLSLRSSDTALQPRISGQKAIYGRKTAKFIRVGNSKPHGIHAFTYTNKSSPRQVKNLYLCSNCPSNSPSGRIVICGYLLFSSYARYSRSRYAFLSSNFLWSSANSVWSL